MSSHSTQLVNTNDGQWYGRCSCKALSPWYRYKHEAEDWIYQHDREVQRARAHLRGRNETLRATYDYYRQREQDPTVSEDDRLLWKMLADGLEHRVGIVDRTTSMF